jgi:excisionase family DNA binding protein
MMLPYLPGRPALPERETGRSVLIDQATQILGVSKRTVYYWIRDGRLRTIRARCGSQRVLLSSIKDTQDQLLATGRRSSSDFYQEYTS